MKRLTLSFAFLFCIISGSNLVQAQAPHPDAGLPAGKGAWVIEQKYKTIIPGTATAAFIYVIIQSDGVVYRRSFLDYLRPLGPWCRDEFVPTRMQFIRTAMSATRSANWGQVYGNFINIYAPWKMLTYTVRDSTGNVSQSRTKMLRFNNIPLDIVRLSRELDSAAGLALTDCNRTLAKNNMTQYRF